MSFSSRAIPISADMTLLVTEYTCNVPRFSAVAVIREHGLTVCIDQHRSDGVKATEYSASCRRERMLRATWSWPPAVSRNVRKPARRGRAGRPRPMTRSPTLDLRSGEQVDGERYHLARADFGQQRRCNRDRPPRPYRVIHQQHRPVEAHPVAHTGAGQQVARPDR